MPGKSIGFFLCYNLGYNVIVKIPIHQWQEWLWIIASVNLVKQLWEKVFTILGINPIMGANPRLLLVEKSLVNLNT